MVGGHIAGGQTDRSGREEDGAGLVLAEGVGCGRDCGDGVRIKDAPEGEFGGIGAGGPAGGWAGIVGSSHGEIHAAAEVFDPESEAGGCLVGGGREGNPGDLRAGDGEVAGECVCENISCGDVGGRDSICHDAGDIGGNVAGGGEKRCVGEVSSGLVGAVAKEDLAGGICVNDVVVVGGEAGEEA